MHSKRLEPGKAAAATTAVVRRRRPKARPPGLDAETFGGEYHSKAIGRALTVLECFPDADTALSLSEIALMSGFPESSLFRVLATLQSRSYLLRNADGSYRLAPKMVYGLVHERAEVTRRQVHSLLDQLNRRFNETTSLAFLFGDRIQVIDVIEAVQDVRATNVLGKTLPPHCSSMAKVITAFQPRERIDRILQVYGLIRLTEKTTVDRLAILAEHERIREQGWAQEQEESAAGICCYGAPLFDERRRVVAALSIICPLIRIAPEREAEIVLALLEVSRETRLTLGLQ